MAKCAWAKLETVVEERTAAHSARWCLGVVAGELGAYGQVCRAKPGA